MVTGRRIVTVALLAVAGCACTSSGSKSLVSPSTAGLRSGFGRLAGQIGSATSTPQVPRVALNFTSASNVIRANTEPGSVGARLYRVDLPAGVWNVKSSDGRLCGTGIHVSANAWQRLDLTYGTARCLDLSGPPSAPPPPPPSTGA